MHTYIHTYIHTYMHTYIQSVAVTGRWSLNASSSGVVTNTHTQSITLFFFPTGLNQQSVFAVR